MVNAEARLGRPCPEIPRGYVCPIRITAGRWGKASLWRIRRAGLLRCQLQAERSEPRDLIAALRNPPRTSVVAAASPPQRELQDRRAPLAESTPTPHQPINNPIANIEVSPSPVPVQANGSATPAAAPYASPVPDKPGFVYSPYDPKYLIDVRGFPPGTQVTDPNSGKVFRVP
jgi:hypothetical protein